MTYLEQYAPALVIELIELVYADLLLTRHDHDA